MSKKIFWGIIIAIVIIIALVIGFGGNKSNTEKPTVKIGATLPLTGPVASLGQDAKNAILLAKEQLKNTKYNYEIIFEDDQFKPAVGASVVNKLISVDNVDVLFSFGSPVGNIVSPIAEKQKVPHINFFASDTKVANGEYNFLHYTPPYIDAKLFIKELNARGIKSLVLFEVADNPGAAALTSAIQKEIAGSDIKILADQKFNSGTRDFRTLISEVKNLHPDVYVLQSSSPELETVFKQMREMGVKEPVTSVETFEFSNNLSLFEGSWYINAADPQKWFTDAYEAKYKAFPKFGAANAYDGLNLAVQVIEKIGNGKTVPTRDEIRKGLAELKSFDGALGKGLSFDENGQLISGAVVRIIKDGKPVTIK